eukprot:362010-Chlamydomonas_euryale.AAC.8
MSPKDGRTPPVEPTPRLPRPNHEHTYQFPKKANIKPTGMLPRSIQTCVYPRLKIPRAAHRAPGLLTPGLLTPGLLAPGLLTPGLLTPGLLPPRSCSSLAATLRRQARARHRRPCPPMRTPCAWPARAEVAVV